MTLPRVLHKQSDPEGLALLFRGKQENRAWRSVHHNKVDTLAARVDDLFQRYLSNKREWSVIVRYEEDALSTDPNLQENAGRLRWTGATDCGPLLHIFRSLVRGWGFPPPTGESPSGGEERETEPPLTTP